MKVGTKIVGANLFKLSESEEIEESDIPGSIEDFPQRLQELIDKYEPVNPQNLAEELRNLQKVFEESQGKLTDDVKYLKDQVGELTKELSRESIRREQETKGLTDQIERVEGKIENIAKENILFGERICNMGDIIKTIVVITLLSGLRIKKC